MRVAVVGTGYVGLVQGTCLAESGNDVVCIDKVESKIEGLRRAEFRSMSPAWASWCIATCVTVD